MIVTTVTLFFCFTILAKAHMPKPNDWTPLIPHALQQLRALRGKVVDRAALQQLLKIHRRTAIRLMHQLG